MKPIREQLREQAEAIRVEWAKEPSPDGMPRRAQFELTLDCPVSPLRAMLDYRGRVNSDATYAPVGCLLLRGDWMTERTTEWRNDGVTFAQRITAYMVYGEIPWNHRVLISDVMTLGARPKILVDRSCPPAYQSADFNEWLDALDPPCQGLVNPPEGPSSGGSWRDLPSQL